MKSFNQIILQPLYETLWECADRNAFFIAGRYYTYRQFSERISAIRCGIRAVDCDNRLFALAIHDDIDTYATVFALWMEGKAYVPLHPNQPLERNLNIVNQVECQYIIDSAQESVFNVSGLSSDVLCSTGMPYIEDCINSWLDEDDDFVDYDVYADEEDLVDESVSAIEADSEC